MNSGGGGRKENKIMAADAEVPEETPPATRILVDADLFISYLTSDNLEQYFRSLVEKAKNSSLELFCSSEVYDDIATDSKK